MPKLILFHNNKETVIEFEGTPRLSDLLLRSDSGVFLPCGGNGFCGKCKATVNGFVSEPTEIELKNKSRLACQIILLGDAEVIIHSESLEKSQIETKAEFELLKKADWKYGAAIDIGTTTVALKLFNENGDCISTNCAINPQRELGDDVLSRISFAIGGKTNILRDKINDCINKLLKESCVDNSISVDEIERLVITGNTAMLYFYCGESPESIASYPFDSKRLFGEHLNEKIYLPRCINAFVGADITCALLSSRIVENGKTALLCDIGTNGEIVLLKDNKLYVASAAAGPAFECGCISCGSLPIGGAVEKAYIEDSKIKVKTIDNKPINGICGSGLIDCVSAFLKLGYIDKSGYCVRKLKIESGDKSVELTQDDIRSFQLAKSAIRAGIESVLKHSETDINEIDTLYISGGFGNKMNIGNAVEVGLIPKELQSKVELIGNGALAGACMILFDRDNEARSNELIKNATLIELGGSEIFYESFIKNIDF